MGRGKAGGWRDEYGNTKSGYGGEGSTAKGLDSNGRARRTVVSAQVLALPC